MKFLAISYLIFILASCGEPGYNVARLVKVETTCTVKKGATEAFVECTDGSKFPIGQAGQDGQDGEDGVVLLKSLVAYKSCTQVLPGIYVEAIEDGEFFDVYSNDTCDDSRGEYCDNVQTSYGSSGTYGQNEEGNGTVCWAEDNQITGKRDKSTGDIEVYILSFN